MNLIDGIVRKVLKVEVRKSSEMWKLKEGEEDKTFYSYTVEAEDIGGVFTTMLHFNEPKEVKEGYRFEH